MTNQVPKTDGRGFPSGAYLNQNHPMDRTQWLEDTFPEWGSFLNQEIENYEVPKGQVSLWWCGGPSWVLKTDEGGVFMIDQYCGPSMYTELYYCGVCKQAGADSINWIRLNPQVIDPFLLHMVKAIQENKAFLGEVDGLIGDGDHGMNMAKGFTLFEKRIPEEVSFSDGLDQLGTILFSEIGGSMGPIYGTIFMDMAAAAEEAEDISLPLLADMMESGLTGLQEIVEARVGDKTLVDTLSPAVDALKHGAEGAAPFADTLKIMKTAAECGRDSTKDMVAKFGRSSRLGERSRGVLDAGAASCCILLQAMADGMLGLLEGESA